MKHLKVWVCSICVILLTTVSIFAQENSQEADHNALRGLKTIFEKAVNLNQIELIEPYLDKDFSVVTFTDREFTNFEKFKTRWEKTRKEMLQGGSYSIKLLPIRSQIIGNIAIAKGDSENVMVTGDGEEFKFTSHWTAICKKTDGEWKILRGHNSLDPFANPMLKSGVKKIVIKMGAGAAVAGLTIGLIIGLLMNRKRRNAQ